MSVSQEIATPVDVTMESMALAPRNVFSGAAMPSVPKRSGAQEGQRHVGHRIRLRVHRARTCGGQRQTRQV